MHFSSERPPIGSGGDPLGTAAQQAVCQCVAGLWIYGAWPADEC